MEWNVNPAEWTVKRKVKSSCSMKCALAYPLNMALAERWKRTSVDVIPTHTPFIARVAGSETQCTCGLPWGGAERGKERWKREEIIKQQLTQTFVLNLIPPAVCLRPRSLAGECSPWYHCSGMVAGGRLPRDGGHPSGKEPAPGGCHVWKTRDMRLFSNRATYAMLGNHSNIITETGYITGQTQQWWENRCQERIRTGG